VSYFCWVVDSPCAGAAVRIGLAWERRRSTVISTVEESARHQGAGYLTRGARHPARVDRNPIKVIDSSKSGWSHPDQSYAYPGPG